MYLKSTIIVAVLAIFARNASANHRVFCKARLCGSNPVTASRGACHNLPYHNNSMPLAGRDGCGFSETAIEGGDCGGGKFWVGNWKIWRANDGVVNYDTWVDTTLDNVGSKLTECHAEAKVSC